MSESRRNGPLVEIDPSGQYVRFHKPLRKGRWKTVYKGFDMINGIEVAWTVVAVKEHMFKSSENFNSLVAEARLLQSLDHENIVKCYKSWMDFKRNIIHMITELCTSGNLRQYTKKYHLVDDTAIKNWCRQILNALDYLHSQDPPIINRNLKGENIYINGNSGTVKIGDLSLAKNLEKGKQKYNQLVDIHSFGLCVLQMVTWEGIYHECRTKRWIRATVQEGTMPNALNNVEDPQLKRFIQRCLVPASERPTAVELLNDPFLAPNVSGTSTASSSLSLRESVDRLRQPAVSHVVKEIDCGDKKFELQGSMKDSDTISMTLRIIKNATGMSDKIEFPFRLKEDTDKEFKKDTVEKVMEEMEIELDQWLRTDEDLAVVTELMEQIISVLLRQPSYHNLIPRDDLTLRRLFAENPFGVEYDDARRTFEISSEQVASLQQPAASTLEVVKEVESEDKKFELQGRMKDNVTISMTLRIFDVGGVLQHTVNFDYSLKNNPQLFGEENLEEAIKLGLSTGDVTLIVELIEQVETELIVELIQQVVTELRQQPQP